MNSINELLSANTMKKRANILSELISTHFKENCSLVTLTYSPENQPKTERQARIEVEDFLDKLRERSILKRFPNFNYIFTIQRNRTNKYIHHEVIFQDVLDCESLCWLWGKGYINIRPMYAEDGLTNNLAQWMLRNYNIIYCNTGQNLIYYSNLISMSCLEAIRRIQDHCAVHNIGSYPHIRISKAMNMAIEALEIKQQLNNLGLTIDDIKKLQEKDTPQRPDYEGDGYDDKGELIYDYATCPICEHGFEEGVNDWGSNYCPDCGQALDWS